jgi:hypothetical protein
MKVLTLHQPYATLVALGVKTIETRSQPFRSLVGQRIAIHAAARRFGINSATADVVRSFPRETYSLLRDVLGVDIEETYVPPAALRVAGRGYPLGAIVCTAVVTDSLPMIDGYIETEDWTRPCIVVDRRTPEIVRFDALLTNADDISDQLPYGDFRPGRFGLLLADVEPVEPYAFKGGQGLSRSVDPALLMARRGDLK